MVQEESKEEMREGSNLLRTGRDCLEGSAREKESRTCWENGSSEENDLENSHRRERWETCLEIGSNCCLEKKDSSQFLENPEAGWTDLWRNEAGGIAGVHVAQLGS